MSQLLHPELLSVKEYRKRFPWTSRLPHQNFVVARFVYSTFIYIYLFIYLFSYLFMYLFIYLFVCLFIYIFILLK